MDDLFLARKGERQLYVAQDDAQAFAEAGYELFRMEPVPVEAKEIKKAMMFASAGPAVPRAGKTVEVAAVEAISLGEPVESEVQNESD